jgi:hypothetical protein
LAWTLAIVAGKPDQIKVGVPGGIALAEALVTYSPANDEAFGGGVVTKFHKCEIVLSTTRWSGQDGWSSLTTFKKSRFVRNAIKHEIGHCMGLEHHNNSSSIMNSTPISQYPDVVLLPIAADQTILASSVHPSRLRHRLSRRQLRSRRARLHPCAPVRSPPQSKRPDDPGGEVQCEPGPVRARFLTDT